MLKLATPFAHNAGFMVGSSWSPRWHISHNTWAFYDIIANSIFVLVFQLCLKCLPKHGNIVIYFQNKFGKALVPSKLVSN